ncbi:MAG: hypothetical protein GXO77_01055 [Calditrichaeota bacterium]|nr:hypothetical protein [Calditrichota bacterium]
MLQVKRSILVAVVAVIGVLGFSSQAFSQNHCYWDNWSEGSGAGWWNNNVPAQYALTADQIAKIDEIRSKYQKKIVPLQNELRSLRMESGAYASRYNADIDKIKKYRRSIRDLEEKIDDYRLDARKDISKILSKEQQVYFRDGGYGWWDAGGNWWHNGRGMMMMNGQGNRMMMNGQGSRMMMDRMGRNCW